MKIKPPKSDIIIIILCVALFFIIGIFWNLDRRRRIFQSWKKKINEIRNLRQKLSQLYSIKNQCDKKTKLLLSIGRTWLVVLVLVGAQWIHWEYGPVWYQAIGYSFGIVGILYKGISFWWFAGKYGVTEMLNYLENKILYIVYHANDFDPQTIKLIEEKIEKLETEALALKLELRAEAHFFKES